MSGLTAGPILAAISGGPDSTALLHGLAAWSRQTSARPPVVAATVDHGLRVEGRAEAEAVASDAASLGLEHRILAWTGARRHPVSQDAARRARYRLLGECAAAVGAAALVTAHTLDDQAETLLIRMAAGSGLSGLGGMRAVTYRGGLAHHRPLLAIPKARLVATCRAGGWRFTDDASNHEARFARTRWRALVPELASEGLDAERLSRLAGRLRRADDALDALAGRIFSRTVVDRVPDGVVLDFARLADEPDEIKLRVLALALRDSGAAPNRLERLERCCESLLEAARAGRLARRTLAGRIVALDGTGTLRILPETARSIARASPVTLPAAGTPHSLGNGETGA
ncbi:tRNA lysidine(34) synthetase TilS [uncultured Enterovirga sp.]|uniref:tRNA lysidine(34) synthetase TilS n=1 Tax=uncultured Enterovirga sp. TaxID=2026352 RepID=UPI0035C9F113